MFEVLCFGDSNTWGYSPKSQERFTRNTRWTGVLQAALGDGSRVIEEGLNGRTTVWDDPIEGDKNGRRQLPALLESHKPLDLVVLMLGTNDLKRRFSAPARDIAAGVERLVGIILGSSSGGTGKAPKVLVIAPPPLARLTDFAEMFDGGTEKSRLLGKHYAQVAAEHGCAFLDAGSVIRSSDLDGIHFDEKEHRALGEAVAKEVRKILGS
ncbi:MAG: SGNH/GDSL hydrolase family protein [Spirochaetes bacterium]|jgi:lysophospholipase L1-like esterase|nr:SGNH/GDSL hydrolase family protein [Spirochaetota bacterium]